MNVRRWLLARRALFPRVLLAVVLALQLGGCSLKFIEKEYWPVRHLPGQDQEISDLAARINTRENAARILQRAIRSSEIYCAGQSISHKGFFGPHTTPPNPAPSWSPVSKATVDNEAIATAWHHQPWVLGYSLPTMTSYRLGRVTKHALHVPLHSVCEVYYCAVEENPHLTVRFMGRQGVYEDGFWILLNDKPFPRTERVEFSDFLFAFHISYPCENELDRQWGTRIWKDWNDESQPEHKKLKAVLAALELLCPHIGAPAPMSPMAKPEDLRPFLGRWQVERTAFPSQVGYLNFQAKEPPIVISEVDGRPRVDIEGWHVMGEEVKDGQLIFRKIGKGNLFEYRYAITPRAGKMYLRMERVHDGATSRGKLTRMPEQHDAKASLSG